MRLVAQSLIFQQRTVPCLPFAESSLLSLCRELTSILHRQFITFSSQTAYHLFFTDSSHLFFTDSSNLFFTDSTSPFLHTFTDRSHVSFRQFPPFLYRQYLNFSSQTVLTFSLQTVCHVSFKQFSTFSSDSFTFSSQIVLTFPSQTVLTPLHRQYFTFSSQAVPHLSFTELRSFVRSFTYSTSPFLHWQFLTFPSQTALLITLHKRVPHFPIAESFSPISHIQYFTCPSQTDPNPLLHDTLLYLSFTDKLPENFKNDLVPI